MVVWKAAKKEFQHQREWFIGRAVYGKRPRMFITWSDDRVPEESPPKVMSVAARLQYIEDNIITPKHTAYLVASEALYNHCSFTKSYGDRSICRQPWISRILTILGQQEYAYNTSGYSSHLTPGQ